jgi:oligosaccharide repeat unit polymerase
MRRLPNDIDTILVFILPVISMALFMLLEDPVASSSALLGMTIWLYLVINYEQRAFVGFSGLKIFAIPSVMLATFTVFLAIPAVYVYDIKSGLERDTYFAAVLSFYLLVPAGYKIIGIFKSIDAPAMKNFQRDGFLPEQRHDALYQLLLILLVISVLTLGLYFIRVKAIPLFEMIRNPGDYFRLAIMREEALKLLPVTFIEKYLFNWARSIFFPIGIVGSFYLAATGSERRYKLLFLIFLLIGVFNNSLTLEKTPTAAVFVSLFVFLFLRRNRIQLRYVLTGFVLVFAFPLWVMFSVHYGRENLISKISDAIFYRLFIVPSEGLYYYFNIFPKVHDFLDGASTNFFAWLQPGGTFPLANYVASIWWHNPLTSGFANVNYVGFFWADFGWPGVIIAHVLVGMIVYSLYWKLMRVSQYQKNLIYTIVTCVSAPLFTVNFFSVNFTSIFFTNGYILIIILLVYFNRLLDWRSRAPVRNGTES